MNPWFLSSRRRRFLRRRSAERFIADLNAAPIRYVVLRWFDRLQTNDPRKNIDVLVDDQAVPLVRKLLRPATLLGKVSGNKGRRIDVYSVSGSDGCGYRGIACYPPHLADRILSRSMVHESGARVPCPEDHFFSFAYHVVFHKGLASGLPVSSAAFETNAVPDHDYKGVLEKLARANGFDVAIEMDALADFLAGNGWHPPHDTLERLLPDDPWAAARARSMVPPCRVEEGLTVFLLRERVLEAPERLSRIVDQLVDDGFYILGQKQLAPAESRAVAEKVRGANWGAGPWPSSGGLPAVAIAALDVFPSAPDAKFLQKQPCADNRRVFDSKLRVRDAFNRDRPAEQRCNIIHSSDNCAQAGEYIALAMPEFAEAILSKGEKLLADCAAEGEVIGTMTRSGKRAVVELVNWRGTTAVRKRFRPGMERYFVRELQALRHLNSVGEEAVPQLLDSGANYIVMSYCRDERYALSRSARLPLSVTAVRNAFQAARRIFDEGVVLHDFRPHNLVVGPKNAVTIIDFEDAAIRGEEDSDLKFEDLDAFAQSNFGRTWGRASGIGYHSLVNDPLWLLRLKRWTIGNARIAYESLKKAGRNVTRSIERRRQRASTKRALRAAREKRRQDVTPGACK